MQLLKKYGWIVGIIVLLVLLGVARQWASAQPGPLDGFAQCINDAGAKFYGAFWCPHCQDQKAMFGRSSKLLPYVECSTPDRRAQTQICIDNKIEGYPLWEFADGTRLDGTRSLEELAEKTGCTL